MKLFLKKIFLLIVLESIILITGYLVFSNVNTGLLLSDLIFLSVIFTVLTAGILFIFYNGQKKNPDSQTMHTLVAVSLKFLIELVFAFLWFFVGKKSGLSDVILFFVLYLAFTLFLLMVIVKELKHKSL
ncbi:MAG TPA: hypothetical protein PLX41_06920 [Bacteroidales bacterium]|nr:hypothetical protein [Bacteroidales bacterium]HPR73380.1 hypothetical protein [Bacteroidales bacterium]